MRLVKHRLHNLELISGRPPAPMHELLPDAPPGHGGWGGGVDRQDDPQGAAADGGSGGGGGDGALSRLGLKAWVQAAVRVGAISGGERGSASHPSHPCDVDVRADLTAAEFATRYVHEGRTVLLRFSCAA